METKDQEKTVPARKIETQPSIVLRDLFKNYDEKQVLKGINLEVTPGHVIGHIGPNGAGKTTTVKILTGMIADYQGQAQVCGFDLATDPLEVKRRIGYVPESAALYDALSPNEYLTFVGRIYGMADRRIQQRAGEMLDLFGLADERENRMSTFSKGMRQKVLITAALMHNPEVVFMDEPLNGLDANSAVTVKEIIARLAARGKTIFYCSHVMDVVERVCDRIVILSDGRIAADGPFDQLQSMSKGDSLERIFTQLTSSGEHTILADRFLDAIKEDAQDG